MELKIELLKVTEMKLMSHCLNSSASFTITMPGNAGRNSGKKLEERGPFHQVLRQAPDTT